MHLIPFVSGIGKNVSWPLTLLKAPAGLAGAVPCHGLPGRALLMDVWKELCLVKREAADNG